MNKLNTRVNLIFLFIVLIWIPLQAVVLKTDAQGRIIALLGLITLIFNLYVNPKIISISLSKPFVFWLLWIIYSTINTVYKGLPEDLNLFLFVSNSLFLPFLVMIIVYLEYLNDSKLLLKSFFVIIISYIFLTFFSLEILKGGRLMVQGVGNSMPNTFAFFAFLILLGFAKSTFGKYKTTFFLVVILIAIVLSGTRKALGAVFVILIFALLSHFFHRSIKTKFTVGFFVMLIYFAYQFIIEKTFIGGRFQQIESDATMFNTTNIQILNFLGDRASYYILGWEVFLDNAFTGIGLRNFMYYTGFTHGLHTEYMVQLAECGVIGTLLFVLFNWSVGRSLIRVLLLNRENKKSALILVGAFLSILFMNLTAWTYAFPIYFAIYGVIIANVNQLLNQSKSLYRKY